MSSPTTLAIFSALFLAAGVAAHGFVQGIVADGVWYQGYNPIYKYMASPPAIPGWSDPKNQDNGFVSDYTSPDIACHLEATPGQAYATVAAGSDITLQWTSWASSHHGPMLDYLANCNGDCTKVDKTALLWNKIDQAGLVDDTAIPGNWASDEMIANNNSWTVTIPSSIAPGKYVLRHETIALHMADKGPGQAQNYPQCINLEVTGSGTNSLQSGTLYNALYQPADPGLSINIYKRLDGYIIPGPPLFVDAASSEPTAIESLTTTAPTTMASDVYTYPESDPISSGIAPASSRNNTASYHSSPGAPFRNGTIYTANRSTTFVTVTHERSSPLSSQTGDAVIVTSIESLGNAIPGTPISSTSLISVTITAMVTATVTTTVIEPSVTLVGNDGASDIGAKIHRYVCYEETD